MTRLKPVLAVAGFAAVLTGVFAWYFRPLEPASDFAFALTGEQRTLDPALTTTLQESRVIRALFEGLVRLDPATLAPVPGAARSWTVSPDGKTYVFRLRPCRWSDGTALTASDFVWSWRRVLEPASISSYDYMLFGLKNAERYRRGGLASFDSVGVSAENDSTLVVTLGSPVPYFLDLCAFETLLPVNRACVEKHGIRWSRPGNMVCNGAYALESHTLNYKMRLVKNAAYWDTARARFKIVDAYTCEGVNTTFNMYESGLVELIDDYPTLIADALLKRPDSRIAPNLGTYFYRFNVNRPPFDDNRVRRAFDLCVDRRAVTDNILKSGEVPAKSLVPPGIPGYAAPQGASYLPDSARKLLAEAGFPGGKGFPAVELLYNTSENHKKTAEALCYMFKRELGVAVTPLNMEWKVLLGRVDNGDYTLARGGWYGDYTDPNTFLDMFVTGGGNNRTGWSSRPYDSLIAAAALTLDPAARMRVLERAEALLLQSGPLINLYHYVSKTLLKPGIGGFTPNIRGYFHVADLYRE